MWSVKPLVKQSPSFGVSIPVGLVQKWLCSVLFPPDGSKRGTNPCGVGGWWGGGTCVHAICVGYFGAGGKSQPRGCSL